MRGRNIKQLKELLIKFGYEFAKKLSLFSFEISDMGFMYVIVLFGEKYENLEDVEKAVNIYFNDYKH